MCSKLRVLRYLQIAEYEEVLGSSHFGCWLSFSILFAKRENDVFLHSKVGIQEIDLVRRPSKNRGLGIIETMSKMGNVAV